MKTITCIITLGMTLALGAQSKFEQAVLKGKMMMDTASSVPAYLAVSNHFERVANLETSEWLPLYYQALNVTFAATATQDPAGKEELLNRALELVQKVGTINKSSESLSLEGFIQMLRLSVDPATRGQSLSPVIYGLLHQAIAMDAKNPRALLLLGQMEYGSSRFFGKSTDEACSYIQKAYDIFEQMPDEMTVMPTWGKGSAQSSLQNCPQ